MKLSIELISDSGYNCVNGLIASVAKWNNVPYEFAFAESWDFMVNYEARGESTYATLCIPDSLNYDLLDSYSGIKLKYIEFDKNNEDFMTTLKAELSQQRPIIIILDYFWCPWNKDVSKITHMENHATLVVGFNEQGLICLDYSPRCEKCILPYENISKIDGYCTINIESVYKTNYNDLFNRSMNVIEGHDIFNGMRKFAKYIRESFEPKMYLDEVENDAWLPNIWQVSLIADGRSLYSKVLRTISNINKMDSLLQIAERLDLAKDKWVSIQLFYTKIYYTNNVALREALTKKIYDIADFEEDIYSDLVSIVKENRYGCCITNLSQT